MKFPVYAVQSGLVWLIESELNCFSLISKKTSRDAIRVLRRNHRLTKINPRYTINSGGFIFDINKWKFFEEL